jgi:sugar-specific transcriptional regulator TrmB
VSTRSTSKTKELKTKNSNNNRGNITRVNVDSPDEDVSLLNELGITVTQAKIYLALAKAKTLNAQEISKLSGVARPHVYQVLGDLLEHGLITKIIDQPERYQAVPISECVSTLMSRRIIRTAELEEKTVALAQKYRTLPIIEGVDKPLQFVFIPKKEAVYAKAEKMLVTVRETIILLLSTRRMINWLSNSSPLFEKTLARGVNCKVIIPSPGITIDLLKQFKMFEKYPTFSLKLLPKVPNFGFTVWDGKELIMAAYPSHSPIPEPALWSDNSCMVNLCQEHFEHLWDTAET